MIGDLDKGSLNSFWRFVCERQNIWNRRVREGREPPWTQDPILEEKRFTNVYRYLDPGTLYVIDSILDDASLSDRDRVFNTMVYRLIGRKETHTRIGNTSVDAFEKEAFEAQLREVEAEAPHNVFTGAYTVCSYHQYGGRDKIENVSLLFSQIISSYKDFWNRLRDAESMKEAFQAIKTVPGFGRFLSYQVLVDLHYPIQHLGSDRVLSFSRNEWAAAGPGARKGIEVLAGPRSHRKKTDLSIMRWLYRHQTREFRRIGLEFPFLQDSDGRVVPLSLPDIQNCLCEFYKYHKERAGAGRCRRRFDHDSARPSKELAAMVDRHPSLKMQNSS